MEWIVWLDEHSGSVTSVAAIVQAALALVLVAVTGIYAYLTNKISTATRDAAEAAKAQAAASDRMVTEMQETRQLTYRPQLVLWAAPT